MKIKLGIVGEKDTLEIIKNVVSEFEDTIIPYYFTYANKREVIDILETYENNIDVFLFSGSDPYYYAKNKNALIKPAVYIPRVETSIYEVLWKIRDEGLDYKKVSIDAISQKSVEEVLNALNIDKENIYVKKYKPVVDYEELVSFHHNLWKNNKINAAVTGIAGAAKKLRELGVPAFRLYPTVQLIREYINKAIYLGDVERIKSTQIALQIIRIENKSREMTCGYEFLKIKNQFENFLIEYTQDNYGLFFAFGVNEYLIFSTRGALNANFIEAKCLKIAELTKKIGISFSSGIGYGNTVYKAEANARIALDYAAKEKYSCCYIVEEQGLISGPIGKSTEMNLAYDLIVTDKKIQDIAEKIDISAAYVSKIKAIIDSTGKNVIDAKELSDYLGISLRSSRRILSQILEAGYGKVIAKESRAGTGRPRRIFEIFL
ncbi:hypothetical protein SH2C18_18300 [Clostridium sediminicola]|uniref:hypothetical protein n=1 Tax=Clostridium sediminicola TaxID=3114879 RepID=UPI0031F20A6F